MKPRDQHQLAFVTSVGQSADGSSSGIGESTGMSSATRKRRCTPLTWHREIARSRRGLGGNLGEYLGEDLGAFFLICSTSTFDVSRRSSGGGAPRAAPRASPGDAVRCDASWSIWRTCRDRAEVTPRSRRGDAEMDPRRYRCISAVSRRYAGARGLGRSRPRTWGSREYL